MFKTGQVARFGAHVIFNIGGDCIANGGNGGCSYFVQQRAVEQGDWFGGKKVTPRIP